MSTAIWLLIGLNAFLVCFIIGFMSEIFWHDWRRKKTTPCHPEERDTHKRQQGR